MKKRISLSEQREAFRQYVIDVINEERGGRVMNPEKGEFSVYEYDAGGKYERIRRWVSAEEAVMVFKNRAKSIEATLGMTTRIIITDGSDSINLEWQYGKGIIFPKEVEKSAEEHSKMPAS